MKRFVRNFIVAVVAIVFVNGQRCHAQVEIVDGNGKQVAENLIPTQSVEDPAPSSFASLLAASIRTVIEKPNKVARRL